ncbi:hypothetical protein BS50DRAFT_614816 [Corynespora cassiicola Philippines]|uniref:DUF7779 domain-containing protein n=1 Tax=Corynespora cassiicola Philippines TaxID=1448308 RepID=A0A2T2N011_CORCC|nr:hypothetical protein BS50DRAFT_614816 [Corynespora cassiicola Philippines]
MATQPIYSVTGQLRCIPLLQGALPCLRNLRNICTPYQTVRANPSYQPGQALHHLAAKCDSRHRNRPSRYLPHRLRYRAHSPVTVFHRLPKPSSSPSSTVPFRRDDDFVHRDSLDEVRRLCARPAGRAALVGLGGVGKSQIAIEYAHQIRRESPATWAFWVHADTRARFEEGYRRIAEAAKIDGCDDPKADVLRLVRSWLCHESNGRWVMVVDNADDASVFFHNILQSHATGSANRPAEPLSDFLPQSPNGSILVTSRDKDAAYRLTGAYSSIIEVRPMDKDDALALLRKKLGPIAREDEARGPRMSVSKYIEEVRRNDRGRGRLLKKDVGDSRRDGQASNSIIMTWQISFDHIRKQMPAAARLLSLMSLFDRQGIPESLLRDRYRRSEDEEECEDGREDKDKDEDEDEGENDEEADFEDDIHTLTSFSLVEMSADGREFEMHRLVQFSTKKWLELHKELERWKEAYAVLMDDSYPVGQYENWPVCQALFPHAQAAADSQPRDEAARKAWASVLFKAAWYASERGLYERAHEMGSAALQAREEVLGAEHRDTLNSLNSLGIVLYWQAQYDEAEAMHKRALETMKRVLGDDNPVTLASMGNLASTYSNQGLWDKAEKLQVEVMKTRKDKLGPDHPSTLTSMNNLAFTWKRQGREDESIALMRERV